MNLKKKSLLYISMLFTIALLAASCSKKISPLTSNLFTVNPSPLEVVGTKVPVTINGNIPPKWFDKKMVVTVTPILKYEGGEAYGTPYVYQGEKVNGNNIVISQSNGANVTLKSEFDYIPAMKKSELYLRFHVSKGGGSFYTTDLASLIKTPGTFADIKIADGVVATAALADALSSTPSTAPDNFQKSIQESYDAEIKFLIQQAELRSSELNSSNLAAWKNLVKEANDNSKKKLNVEVSAYASPDGGYKLNEGLAEKREKNTSSYLKKEFKNNSINTGINAHYTAQDWDGFKKLVEVSNLQDKDLILRVLSMYTDTETREREIKNISVVYKDLAETILPQLRRSRLIANVEIIGKTDAELQAAVANDMGSLSVEELLYAATLTNSGSQKEKIYLFITKKYPNDYRGWNNLGTLYYQNGLTDKANQAFVKASQINAKSAETNTNLALMSLSENNIAKAEQLLGNSSGANTANEALGLLYLKKGDYTKAAQSFGDAKTNNAAVANILTKNYSKAEQILNAVPNKDATTSYLKAIIAARTNNISGVISGLKAATEKDPSLKREALKDLEFAKFVTNPDIANLLK
ncbi:hypothetical protein M2132_002152 [Dysgonomonas sp. PH5-45]|uniref:tetratricopeptide repeat protein n=1 Tax=unclassified Dysgonomonas TaxID=2630389 RepID=UPI0024768E62|nr:MULTISPECIES: hypothetical protein [unclassified Dysgonomonas]MDH6355805.1 hypothetical protein [Dysgonomonas sp. PH5-45]MDH6388702.1 hypothetical protein [Dysgonomonas sp. PH5-37]